MWKKLWNWFDHVTAFAGKPLEAGHFYPPLLSKEDFAKVFLGKEGDDHHSVMAQIRKDLRDRGEDVHPSHSFEALVLRDLVGRETFKALKLSEGDVADAIRCGHYADTDVFHAIAADDVQGLLIALMRRIASIEAAWSVRGSVGASEWIPLRKELTERVKKLREQKPTEFPILQCLAGTACLEA